MLPTACALCAGAPWACSNASSRLSGHDGSWRDRPRLRLTQPKLGVAVVEQSSPQQPRIHLEVLAAQAPFDHDLPKARAAEDELVTLRLDQVARRRGQVSASAPEVPAVIMGAVTLMAHGLSFAEPPFAHLARRVPKAAAERPVEIAEVVESNLVGDVADAKVIEAPAEQLRACPPQPLLAN